MDVFKIGTQVTAGDTLVAHFRTSAANLDPYLRIYRPNGVLLCEDSTIFNELVLSCKVSATGFYTVFVFGGDNQTGSYEICVNDDATSCDYRIYLPQVVR